MCPVLAGQQGQGRGVWWYRCFSVEGRGARQFSHTYDKALQEERERREYTTFYIIHTVYRDLYATRETLIRRT